MQIYKVKRYFALALDPIHIGTGGYRIGRVDNTIVREPATGIPKIPATSIEGVCRSYAYLKAKEDGKNINLACAKGKKIKIKEKRIKNGEKKIIEVEKNPCGNCRLCVTFGYTTDNRSMQAMALFSDARILFFPVATMIGPVWVTCPMVLRDAGIKEIDNGSEKDISEPNDNTFIVPENCKINPPEGKLNFGWLLLNQDNSKKTNINNWIYYENNKQKNLKDCGIPKEILSRIVIVSDDLFVTIVNSNLEVRTSVAIDPITGAAEEGALFTYEAIPRGTVLWFDVTYQNPEYFGLNGWNTTIIEKVVENGLSMFEYLGIGGMGSRGFGKLKVIGDFVAVDDYLKALEMRLKHLKDQGKNEELEVECKYLKYFKESIKHRIGRGQEIINEIDRILGEFCLGDEDGE